MSPFSHHRKVFCVGFHKTGTSSMTVALRQLGYHVTGPNGVDDPTIASSAWTIAKRLSYKFDAFQDNPWPIFFRELDLLHPGSHFVLTIRDTEAWLASVRSHFGGKSTPMREWIYGFGDPKGHEALYAQRYVRHNNEVIKYFSKRPQDLLVLRLEDGLEWAPLCRFLGHSIPSGPFPHVNRARDRTRWKELNRLARKLLRKDT